MHDFFCRNPYNMHPKILVDRARYLKVDEEGVAFMCREFEEVREMGVKMGVKIAAVRKIVVQLNACKSASR